MNYGSLAINLVVIVIVSYMIWSFKKKGKKLFVYLGVAVLIFELIQVILAVYGHSDGTYSAKLANRALTNWYIMDPVHDQCKSIADFGPFYTPQDIQEKFNCLDVSTPKEVTLDLVHLDCRSSQIKTDLFFAKGKDNCLKFNAQMRKIIAEHIKV